MAKAPHLLVTIAARLVWEDEAENSDIEAMRRQANVIVQASADKLTQATQLIILELMNASVK